MSLGWKQPSFRTWKALLAGAALPIPEPIPKPTPDPVPRSETPCRGPLVPPGIWVLGGTLSVWKHLFFSSDPFSSFM